MKQQIFAEGDRPPVLHGPEREIRNGYQVQLGQGIGDPVVGLTEFKGFSAQICSKACKLLHSGQGDHPYAVIFLIRRKFKLADPEENEISRHFGSLFKGDPHFAAVEHALIFNGPVGDAHQVRVDVHADIECGLAGGMIHTGERPPGITFFKLGDSHVSGLILISISAPVKPGHFIVDNAPVINR